MSFVTLFVLSVALLVAESEVIYQKRSASNTLRNLTGYEQEIEQHPVSSSVETLLAVFDRRFATASEKVIHYPTNYKLDFNAAKTYCESRGTSIATYEDLDGAYKDGYEKCACGWAANGIAYLVMQVARQGCASSAGIFDCTWQSTWDVFCKRRVAPVIHYPTNYKLDFNAAKTYCESKGTSIATYEDLDGAYKDGYEKCACGWAANGIAYLVMQVARQGCASSAGIFDCTWQSTWDVFCKRRVTPVIHYPTNYNLDFNAAKMYCESKGTSIATYEDLDGAYKDGYEKCACGWAANGIAYLVMQVARQGCASSAGIFDCTWQSTWDVFCKRRVTPVIHYPTNYKLDFNAAKTYCESRGTSIATYEDLDGAYKDGYEKCACGWASNGTAYLVMQAARQGCSFSAGIFNCSWQSTWDVFCKRRMAPVTHYPTNYKLDFNAAKTYCESRGTSIATYEDLDGAYKDGYEKCACGWAANGIAYLVMQVARQGCASSAGIFDCSWQSTWDVFCKRRVAPVTHYPTNYKLDFNAAKTYCESRGTSIATYEDLDGAYKDGYEKCACGWAANGIAYLVIQVARQGCASSAGIFDCSWQSTWDVFCKRRVAPVTHYPTNYKLDFNAAKTYCESRGTSIATYEDLDGAYKDGYEKCACGWAANGIAYLVIQVARQGCASSAGIFDCSWQSTWDVFCKRRVAPVIHYPTNYKLDFNAAKTYCESRGTSIATYEDLDGAYKDGYEKCACGWAANGIAYLVMQVARQGCASSSGIFDCSWQSTWDVFCKRRVAPVTHYPTNYKLDFNAAKTYCESRGTSIATYEDLDGAYKDGYEKCACGWAANGIAYLVMQVARQGCASSAGIFDCSWQSTWDVFCKRRVASVTHYPTNYKLDFNAAKTYCESRGTSIATYEDLDGAYKDGYEKCACGWAANGIAYLVMQVARQGCASSAGIFDCSWQSTWDVFCKRRVAPVTHYPTNYKLDFNAAKTYCESRGTSIATYEDLDGAYKDGYEKCACGWAANGIAYLVIQVARQGCASSAGIFDCSWQSTWDVFCKRRLAPVTHYPTNYNLDFNAAKTYCESRGTSIATYEDLDGAYKDGYEKCACGWVANGTAYLVMQVARQGCASSAGIFDCSWQSTWDVFCKG